MAIGLSLLAFLIVIIYGFEYAFLGKTYLVSTTWNKKVKFKVNTQQRFILFLLATAIVQAGNFSALLLLIWMVFLLGLLFKYGIQMFSSPMLKIYALYLCWLLFSLVLTTEKGYGIRVFFKFLFPFLVILVVTSIKITDVFFIKALKISFLAGVFINGCIVLMKIIPIYSIYNPILWWPPAVIDVNPFFIGTGILLYKFSKKKYVLFAILLFISIPIVESVRTGLIGIGVFFLAVSFFKYKLKALPVFILIIASFVASVLFVPTVRDKMFRTSFNSAEEVLNMSGKISPDTIDSNGRFAMWEWSLKVFYKGNELMGAGLGQMQARFYSGNHPFGVIRIAHNDYLQILCDTGQIGFVLYLLIIISFVWQAFRIYNNKKNNVSARYAAFIAGTSLCGIMATAFTDNVVNYSLITLSYPYIFFGFALVMKSKRK
ncbi:O-antigen ligase [Polaribacter sp. AHE13PA]|jgi:O-antigen ligase|uniref:O-antigen ligase family protein n=1 Tax=Polaribacter sp. AHE13PA TaxID=2745562 RepID=UPI001C4EBCA5|nr:O-antigen ligase family protein [Polaribacter sp. AHE13PA]QXP67967.1 O-antigen ligase family protein [Polaribacter sp. AHE13PA]